MKTYRISHQHESCDNSFNKVEVVIGRKNAIIALRKKLPDEYYASYMYEMGKYKLLMVYRRQK